MYSGLILAIILSMLLLGGGLAILASDARTRRAAVAARILLINRNKPAAAGLPTVRAGALMRAPTGKVNQAELQEILRVCRALRIPDAMALIAYAWLRASAAAILGFVGFVVAPWLLKHPALPIHMMATFAAAALGWIAPSMVVARFAKQHSAAAAAGLSEALELLVVCVGAGLSLEDAIDRITGELKWSRPALAQELVQTSADLKILPDRDLALSNLADRIDVPSVRSVVTALSQTLRYGTPLAQALRTTAAELRNDGLLQMEERANRLPTLLTLPMMLFIMPTTFLIIGGPAALRLMDMFAKQ